MARLRGGSSGPHGRGVGHPHADPDGHPDRLRRHGMGLSLPLLVLLFAALTAISAVAAKLLGTPHPLNITYALLNRLLGLGSDNRQRLFAVVRRLAVAVREHRRRLLRARPATPGAALRLATQTNARSGTARSRSVRGGFCLRVVISSRRIVRPLVADWQAHHAARRSAGHRCLCLDHRLRSC